MKFKIVCRNPQGSGQEENWLYDNRTGKISDPAGVDKTYWLDPRFIRMLPPNERLLRCFSSNNPIIGKSRRLHKLKIQLGLACNKQCSYCLQKTFRSAKAVIAGPQSVKNFVSSLKNNEIILQREAAVEFWGGEPLIYFRTLRELVPALNSYAGTKLRYSIVTNGTLLTDEIVDFLVENNINTAISHDGPGFNLRGGRDPLDDPKLKSVWLRLFEKSVKAGMYPQFHVVLTPANCRIDEIKRFFDERFFPNVLISFEGIVRGEPVFTQEEARQLDASLFRMAVGSPGCMPNLDFRIHELMNRLIFRTPMNRLPGRCDNGNPQVLTVDMSGNVLACQNRTPDSAGIGRLDAYEEILNRRFTNPRLIDRCRGCLVLASCLGSCPILSEEERSVSCRNEFIYHAALFGVAWFFLTGRILVGAYALQEEVADA